MSAFEQDSKAVAAQSLPFAANDFVGAGVWHWAQERPNQPALRHQGQTLSWQHLQQRLEKTLYSLSQQLEPGQALIVNLRCPLRLLLAVLAVARLGGRSLVFDPSWPRAQCQSLMAQWPGVPCLSEDNWPLKAEQSLPPSWCSQHLPLPRPSDAFYVGFTSGSTGQPKGYCRDHASWLASFAISAQLSPAAASAPGAVMAPGSLATSLHLYGLVQALHLGLPVLLVPSFRPKAVLALLASQPIAQLYVTPTQAQLLWQAGEHKQAVAANVRQVLISGSSWPEAQRQAMRQWLPNTEWIEFYGTSEMSFVSLHSSLNPAPSGSVGKPVPGVQLSFGTEPGQVQSPGQPARLWVASPLLFMGYESGGGEEIARHGPWLTVGDHGYVDDQGYLYVLGREKRMLVCQGHNVYPEAVEAVLLRHPAIAQVAVLGVADPLRGQILLAFVQPLAGSAVTLAMLRRHATEHLLPQQRPRHWYRLDHWPLTHSGKTDLQTLAHWAQTQAELCPL